MSDENTSKIDALPTYYAIPNEEWDYVRQLITDVHSENSKQVMDFDTNPLNPSVQLSHLFVKLLVFCAAVKEDNYPRAHALALQFYDGPDLGNLREQDAAYVFLFVIDQLKRNFGKLPERFAGFKLPVFPKDEVKPEFRQVFEVEFHDL